MLLRASFSSVMRVDPTSARASTAAPCDVTMFPLRFSFVTSSSIPPPSLARRRHPLSPRELSERSSSPSCPPHSMGISELRPHGPIPLPRSRSPRISFAWRRLAREKERAKAPSCSSLLHERSRCVSPRLLRNPGARCWMPWWRRAFQSRSRCMSVLLRDSADPSSRAPAGPIPFSPRSSEWREVLVKSARASCVAPSGASSLRLRLSILSDVQAAKADESWFAPLHRMRLNPRSSPTRLPFTIADPSASAAPARIKFHDKFRWRREVHDATAWAMTIAPSVRMWLSVRLRRWSPRPRHPVTACARAVAPSAPNALS
mmetsp:Transcript_69052/g.143984  ORF Transcript_69052/g.143984 Transcript_69052/m.143984 type:complete len:317 (+) Transcript_69052:262-1212(+)